MQNFCAILRRRNREYLNPNIGLTSQTRNYDMTSNTAASTLYVNPDHARIVREVLHQLETADWESIAQHPGMHETLEHFPLMLAAFPDLNQTFEQEFSVDDRYTYIINVTGTHLGDYFGVPATGRKVSFQLIGIEQIVDGKIVAHNAIPDAFSLYMQLGVSFVTAHESSLS
jgi:predicted ester cyclase